MSGSSIVWFRCTQCERECYCEPSLARRPAAEVLCPFCQTRQPLEQALIQQDEEVRHGRRTNH